MTSMIALGATAPRYTDSTFGTAAEPSNRTSCRYRFVRNDSTGHAERWADETFRDRIGNTIIEFVDAMALEMVERNAGFVSINESSPDFPFLAKWKNNWTACVWRLLTSSSRSVSRAGFPGNFNTCVPTIRSRFCDL